MDGFRYDDTGGERHTNVWRERAERRRPRDDTNPQASDFSQGLVAFPGAGPSKIPAAEELPSDADVYVRQHLNAALGMAFDYWQVTYYDRGVRSNPVIISAANAQEAASLVPAPWVGCPVSVVKIYIGQRELDVLRRKR